MCLDQYKANCRKFDVPMNIVYADNKGLIGLGGVSGALGTVTIPIPVNDLGIKIEVKFRVIRNKCPSLFSLNDMLIIGIHFSI